MSWYYVQDGEAKGPVEQEQFEALVRDRVIHAGTMLWREGMATWQPYAEPLPPGPEPPIAPVAVTPRMGMGLAHGTCSRCGGDFRANELLHIGGVAVCATCKPLALQPLRVGVTPRHDHAEDIRKTHLSHEVHVKSVGSLYFVTGCIFGLAGLAVACEPAEARQYESARVYGIVAVVLALALISTGVGLRQLRPWSRILSGILAGIGLLGFPLGTLINGFILYLLFSEKGSMVFSEPYHRVIAATPHVKYRTPIVLWIALGIFLLFIAWVFYAGLSGPRRS
jgi:hypothetical protein